MSPQVPSHHSHTVPSGCPSWVMAIWPEPGSSDWNPLMSILGVARSCAVSLLGLGMLLPASGAVPGDGGRPPLRLAVHAFDIPPQSLASALVTYSGVTGMAVLVDGELARGRRSARLQGRFTASDALTRLLGGTGLMARYTSQEAFTLLPAQAVRNARAAAGRDAEGRAAAGSALRGSGPGGAGRTVVPLAAHSSGYLSRGAATLDRSLRRGSPQSPARLDRRPAAGQRPGGKPARRAGDAGDARYAGPAADHPVAAEDDGQGHGMQADGGSGGS